MNSTRKLRQNLHKKRKRKEKTLSYTKQTEKKIDQRKQDLLDLSDDEAEVTWFTINMWLSCNTPTNSVYVHSYSQNEIFFLKILFNIFPNTDSDISMEEVKDNETKIARNND